MLKRFVKTLSAWMCALLVPGLAANRVLAETTIRIDYGKVEAIEIYRGSDNQPVNVGTLVGGVAGGVIGHPIGGGRRKHAATIAGAIGGAVIGNEIEKKQVQGARYRITVQLDSGSTLI